MTEQAPKRKRSAPSATDALKVPASLLGRITTLAGGEASLVMAFGETASGSVLVPFLDISLSELADDETCEIFEALVPLESAGFIVSMLANGMSEALRDYAEVVGNGVAPEPSRIRAIADYLARTRASLDELEAITATLAPRKGK